jgi:hypothetical protein
MMSCWDCGEKRWQKKEDEQMSKVKLAEALLRRKELQGKVDTLRHIKGADLFEVKTTRKLAHEGIDDVIAQVPKLTAAQVTREFDWHCRQLRLVDAAIQQANWTTEIELSDSVMEDYPE